MKRFAFALAALAMVAAPTVQAAPCKDAKGKFVKCPPPKKAAPTVKKGPCRDAKGKFIKCAK